jgi:hypothetical protein
LWSVRKKYLTMHNTRSMWFTWFNRRLPNKVSVNSLTWVEAQLQE